MTAHGTPRPFPSDIPFLSELGVEFLGMGDGRAEVGLTLEKRHLNSWHVAHGGITMTLLDVVMSMAGRSLDPDARGGVTIEMKTSFMQPGGREGSRVVAKGHAFHRSATMVFCEGELWNDDKLVAKAMGTFKYLKRVNPAKKPEPETPDVPSSGPRSGVVMPPPADAGGKILESPETP